MALVSKDLALNNPYLIPDRVKPLLTEFTDLHPNELLVKLSLIREIQRNIDLTLGSSLPNPPNY